MKKFNLSSLPYLGAAAQAVMFSFAGVVCWGAWGWVIGPGVGAVVNLSLATAASRISDVAKARKPLAYGSLFLLAAVSPATIALSLYAPASVWTAIAWGASVDLAIVLSGAIAGKALVGQSEAPKVSGKVRGKRGKPAKVLPQVARKPVTDDALLAYLAANPGESHQQVAAHFGVSRQAIGQRVKKLYEVKQ